MPDHVRSTAEDQLFHTLRADAPLRYFAAQFAPAAKRHDLLTLALLDHEVTKIATSVREPMAGEIRLQWWREVAEGHRRDEAAASPVAAQFQAMLTREAITPSMLMSYFDGRIFDLYVDPVQDKAAFEAYAGQTCGSLLQLSNYLLSRDAMLAGAELSGYLACVEVLLRRVVFPARHGLTHGLRYLPPDRRQQLGGSGNPFLDDEPIASGHVADAALDLATDYLREAVRVAPSVPSVLAPSYVSFVPLLKLMRNGGTLAQAPIYKLIWWLWRGSRRWPIPALSLGAAKP